MNKMKKEALNHFMFHLTLKIENKLQKILHGN